MEKYINLFISNKTINKINIELPNLKNKDLETSVISQNINDISLIKERDSDYNIELFLKRFSNIKKLKLESKKFISSKFTLIENKNIIIEELELPNPSFPVHVSSSYLRSLSIDFFYQNYSYNYSYKYLPLFKFKLHN